MDQKKFMQLLDQIMEEDEADFENEVNGNLIDERAIIRPSEIGEVTKTQQSLSIQPVLDFLCLTEEMTPLCGVPEGSTIVLSGPPGCGKTRTGLESIIRVANQGIKCLLVVAEEGYHDPNSGRDDLHSRLLKLATKLGFERSRILSNLIVVQSQYHRGQRWSEFVKLYRWAVEEQGIQFAVIDSITALDPLKKSSVDNLNILKTYSHQEGITCLVTSQVGSTGDPAGGNYLLHVSDVGFHIEERGLGSKDEGAKWGMVDGKRGDKFTTIRAIKSNTTPIFSEPIRIHLSPIGTLSVHPDFPPFKQIQPLSPKAVDQLMDDEWVEAIENETRESKKKIEKSMDEMGIPESTGFFKKLDEVIGEEKIKPKRITNKMIAGYLTEHKVTEVSIPDLNGTYHLLKGERAHDGWATEKRLNEVKKLMGPKEGTGVKGVEYVDF